MNDKSCCGTSGTPEHREAPSAPEECSASTESSCCCCDSDAAEERENKPWMIGNIDTAEGSIPVVSTNLSVVDILGAWKVRWGFGRSKYRVSPGLYAVGKPDADAPVLVSANYKLTFDYLRKELSNQNCWLLILDTKGINVWCAAGKGTFGTEELVEKINETGLASIVAHRRLLLPQLGAVGVAAHTVTKETGFSVGYGPVRAADIPAFITAGQKATPEMREVRFSTWDRLILTPMEFMPAARFSLILFGVLFIINLLAEQPFGPMDFIAYVGAVLVGTVLTPVLLPILPGRVFAWKGWLLGFIWTVLAVLLFGRHPGGGWLSAMGWLLALPAVSGYLAMNFTGSSTFTSVSGVIKEMKQALPLLMGSGVLGCVLLLLNAFMD